MADLLFHCKKIVCAYPGNPRPVLSINELIIPKGKIVFILGSSGSGKSTLLETLGLMNKTMTAGEIEFYPENDKSYHYSSLANESDTVLSQVRKKHFSFIFQQTNLMENFTAFENVCLSGMIKDDADLGKHLGPAEALMSRLKLPKKEVNYVKMPSHLSGGQRQRLSFVRGFNNSSSVLFCDEPTGNLDEANANELMYLLKEEVVQGRTAIIVSHDIKLALKHADTIIVLTKDVQKSIGQLLLENIFERPQWVNDQSDNSQLFYDKIRALFKTEERSVVQPANTKTDQINKSIKYKTLFFKRELKTILGKSYLNLITLSFTFLLTFLALGFANGSLNYLENKMNSPFVNLVTFEPSLPSKDDRLKLLEELNNESSKRNFNYHYAVSYENDWLFFYKKCSYDSIKNLQLPSREGFYTRTVKPSVDNQLIKEQFLNDDNYLYGSKTGFDGDKDFSIIVTKGLLNALGYSDSASFVYWSYPTVDTTIIDLSSRDQIVPVIIPIRAVVKLLPGNCNVLIPEQILNAIFSSRNDGLNREVLSPFHQTSQLHGFFQAINSVSNSGINTEEIKSKAARFASENNCNINVVNDFIGFRNFLSFSLETKVPFNNYKSLDSLYNKFWSAFTNANVVPIRLMKLHKPNYSLHGAGIEKIAVYFKSLDNVELFADFILNKNIDKNDDKLMKVDISTVNEKKNFLFLSKVTNITSYFLVFFSTIAISLFVYFLIKTHLNKVSMNLGTFKAIGLTNKTVISVYFYIVVFFFMLSISIGVLLSFISGKVMNRILLSNVTIDDDINYFVFAGPNTYLAISVILVFTFLISFLTIKRILVKTPGDLIYNR